MPLNDGNGRRKNTKRLLNTLATVRMSRIFFMRFGNAGINANHQIVSTKRAMRRLQRRAVMPRHMKLKTRHMQTRTGKMRVDMRMHQRCKQLQQDQEDD